MNQLNEIRKRNEAFQSGEIVYRERDRRELISDSTILHDQVGYLLDRLDKQQIKLDARNQHQKVHNLVDQFLAKGRLSDGGYAPFTREDERLLHELLCALDEAKFQRDPDGDTPLNWVIINRTKYQPHHYVRVPYTHENLDGAFRDSLLNLEMATKAVRECTRLIRREMSE
jgi:hypothetical protein